MPDNNVDYKRYAEISKLILKGYEEKAFNDVNGMTKYIIDNYPDVENRDLLKVLVDKKNQAVVSEVKVDSFTKLYAYNDNKEIFDKVGKTVSLANKINNIAGNLADIIDGAREQREFEKKIFQIEKNIKETKDNTKIIKYKREITDLENQRKQGLAKESFGFLGTVNNLLNEGGATKVYSKFFSSFEKYPMRGLVNGLINESSFKEGFANESISGNADYEWLYKYTDNGTISIRDVNEDFKNSKDRNKARKLGIFRLRDALEKVLFPNGEDTGDSKKIYTDEEIDKLLKRLWDSLKKKGKSPTPPKKGGDHMGGNSPKHLNEGRKNAKRRYDPLVVDLENDGFDMLNSENGVHFDLDGDILKEKTTWISKKDGFLSIDLNDNGKIDNGAELFGDTFMLADSKR